MKAVTAMILVTGLGVLAVAVAAERPGARRVEKDGVILRVTPRTPEQIMAFYEARGFPPAAVKQLATSACFLGIGVRNRRKDIVWLEPARWRLSRGVVPVSRLDRSYWDRLWKRMNLPAANRSTFGWTQLPESRDLRPGEYVGGNITIEPVMGPFGLLARFALGRERDHGELVFRLDGLECPGRGGQVLRDGFLRFSLPSAVNRG